MIYQLENGFVISSGGAWLPGVFESERAARYAFRFEDEALQRLQESVNPGGIVTLEMLRREKAMERVGAQYAK